MRKRNSTRRNGTSDIHLDLNRLVDYHFSIMDFGWAPTSILHRVSTEGHVERGRPGPTILCPHMPADLALLQRAYLALTSADQQVITVKYMPYTIEDRKATDKDRCRFMGVSHGAFRARYSRAIKRIKSAKKRLNA